MKLGFVSAILPDLPLDEVVAFAAKERFECVELMCWPVGRAERRYAGVTHVEVDGLDQPAADRIRQSMQQAGVEIIPGDEFEEMTNADVKMATDQLRALFGRGK